MRRLNDLKALGEAWASKTKTEGELAAWRKIQAASAERIFTRPLAERRSDLHVCACGKMIYRTKKEAIEEQRIAAASGMRLKVYACPLGHPVYHMRAAGRSTRQGRLP